MPPKYQLTSEPTDQFPLGTLTEFDIEEMQEQLDLQEEILMIERE